jgi:hypothetical protein
VFKEDGSWVTTHEISVGLKCRHLRLSLACVLTALRPELKIEMLYLAKRRLLSEPMNCRVETREMRLMN